MLHSNRARFVASKKGAGKKSAASAPYPIGMGHVTNQLMAIGLVGPFRSSGCNGWLDNNFKTLPK